MNNKEAREILYTYRPTRPQKLDKRRLQQAIDKALSTMDAFETIVTSAQIGIRSKWRKDHDTLKCTNCGFGYFPTDLFYMNGNVIKKDPPYKHIFNYCPNCGEKMQFDDK